MMTQKISAIVGAALLTGGLLAGAGVQAQPGPYRDDHRPPPPPPAQHHRRPPPPRPVMVRPSQPIMVGNALPMAYRGYNYRVDNWDHYRLPHPRRGQYWVQYGSQFVLVNPAGVVVQIFVP